MSTLAVNTITNAAGGDTAQINGMTPTGLSLQGFRNRIFNGGMVIDQRNNGAAVTANGALPVDRFIVQNSTDGAYSAQQDSSAPAGFVNSLKYTTTTADGTLTTTQNSSLIQRIEGTNVADLGWGTANAQTVTLSFWVRSSLTGTFGGSLRNADNTRSYPYTYTISAADTFEYKTVEIEGDTSGTWLTTTGTGVVVIFGLGAGPDISGTAGAWAGTNYVSATGAVSVIGTLNATWFVTGVQLEAGAVATPFERRPFGAELALCQRYFMSYGGLNLFEPLGLGIAESSTVVSAQLPLPVPMRTTPSLTTLNPSNMSGTFGIPTNVVMDTSGFSVAMIRYQYPGGGITGGAVARFFAGNSLAPRLQFSAEL